jgi:membrane fusion protein, heavy metal efflux system
MPYFMLPMKTVNRTLAGAVSLLPGVMVFMMGSVIGHEGHAPLPTRGAQVDVAQGLVTLSSEARASLDVQTEEIGLAVIEDDVLAYASIVAPWQKHAFVTSRISGRITSLLVKPGQQVSVGETLAEVESPELYDLQLALLNAWADVQLSDKLLRQTETIAGSAVPGRRLQEAESKHSENLSNLAIARRKLHVLELTDESLDALLAAGNAAIMRTVAIKSPISGTLIHSDLAVGRVIDPTEHLFEIVDLNSVWGAIEVLERDLHKIEVGQAVELTPAAYSGEVVQGTVHAKGNYLDPVTHLGTVWTEFSNATGNGPRLLPGMRGQARVLATASKRIIAVPLSSLIKDGVESYVFVEEAATARASEYRRLNVTTGLESLTHVQVLGGTLFAGDRVVTMGSHELASFFVQGILRPGPEAAENIGLRVEPVERQLVEDVIEFDGVVDLPPDRRATVSSPLIGTIQKILVDRDQVVRAGDVLAEIRSLELQTLQLDLLTEHLRLVLLEKTVARLKKLDDSKILPGRELWQAESARETTLNRRESARHKLASLGLSSDQLEGILTEQQFVETLPLRAPIDGIVVHFDKVLGQVVRADEPLFEVHDISQAWIQGFLSERDLATIRVGQRARVRLTADPDFVGDAILVRSGQVFGEDNQTLSVWLELNQPSAVALRNNLLARVTVSVGRPAPTLAVPTQAIVNDGLRSYVFVQEADGRFDRRLVNIGRADDRWVEITRGLRAGDFVAVRGAAALQTGLAAVR